MYKAILTGYLAIMAVLFGLILLLSNAQPAQASASLARAEQVVETPTPAPPADLPPQDTSWLANYSEQAQELLAPAVAGIPIAFLVLVWTSGAAFVGLANTAKAKRWWAIVTGLAFGLLASLQAIPATTDLTTMAMILLLAGAVVRGLTAGILAALLYESGGALIGLIRKDPVTP
jgi:hypothetical protein